MIIAAPVFFSCGGRNTVIVGLVTFVSHFAAELGASAAERKPSSPIARAPASAGTSRRQTSRIGRELIDLSSLLSLPVFEAELLVDRVDLEPIYRLPLQPLDIRVGALQMIAP